MDLDNLLGIVEEAIGNGEFAANASLIYFLVGKVVLLAIAWWHVARAPDENNVDEGKASQATDHGSHSPVVAHVELMRCELSPC